MKMTSILKYTLVVAIGLGAANALVGADAPATPEKRPTPEEWQKMTPEERQAKMKEMREKAANMTPEQREAQRKMFRERMEKRLEELKKKKADGSITEQETKQMEMLEKRLQQWDTRGKEGTAPAKPVEKKEEKKEEKK
jgi:hypothetical protein